MKIVFKMDTMACERAIKAFRLNAHQDPGFMIEPTRLTYEGSHENFVKHLFDIDYVFRNDSGSVLRPMVYESDDPRLKWHEDLETYLASRGTWLEFALESTSDRIPNRFLSRHEIQKHIEAGKPADLMLHEYSEQDLCDVVAFMARHGTLSGLFWSMDVAA